MQTDSRSWGRAYAKNKLDNDSDESDVEFQSCFATDIEGVQTLKMEEPQS